jgi:hypothetical protein
MELTRPAAPRQRQRSATIGQRQRAQRAVGGLLRIVEHQDASSRWQVPHTHAHEAFENRRRVPLSLRQDASQATFDRVGVCGGCNTPQLGC